MFLEKDDLKFNFGCASCGYKNVSADEPIGRINVNSVISKLDGYFSKNDMVGAGRLLEYWQGEAVSLRDKRGELSIVNEMLGFYRKMLDKEKGLASVSRSIELVALLGISEEVSGATVLLNAATTLKAFGEAERAVGIYADVLSVYSEKLDAGDARLGGFYNNYALALTDLGRYEDAHDCYEKALGIMKNAEGGIIDCAATYVNMAHLFEAWHGAECEDIEKNILNALEIINGEDAPRDSYYAFVLSKCAPSFEYFGFFADAHEMKERSDKIYERA